MAATDFKDYYSVLGISKAASPEEVKRAYRRLARQFHPDVNPGNQAAEARFKEVNEAYEVLGDPDKRKKYDQFGQYWRQAEQRGSASSSSGFDDFEFGRFSSFDEFIGDLLGRFGGTAAGQKTYSSQTKSKTPGAKTAGGFKDFGGFGDYGTGQSAGMDAESSLTLTVAEAFHGVQKRLSINGEAVDVRIPPGAKVGTRIRLKGKGRTQPYSQQRGDLYLVVNLQPHPFFQFEGDQLVCDVPITPDEAALGAEITVPTPDGSVSVRVPPGVRPGQSLRLRGKGWPSPKGERGDQLVRISIALPKTLSSLERECYEKIRTHRTFDPRSHLKGMQL